MSPSGEAAPAARDVVVGFETYARSGAALVFAADLAGRLRVRLRVVHVVDSADYPGDPDLAGSDLETRHVRDALAGHRADVERALADFAGEWSYAEETGDALHRITAIAHECDALMIVVGGPATGPGSLLHRWSERSVARALAGHAERPVLVVPGHPPPADVDDAHSP
ncbi:universal stress protein [Embleya scabrispora]|uniref:universal stress protein n=1 Tax=Embleya scabrispora TaxID=159449 RepID=UPI00036BD86F|nr:universal stress protein [Embleya scabrispora]MYS87859.1 universal stress protein [Streptomyces sp. SID5474]